MFAILNQVQGHDCSLANAEKLKIVQLPSETQRSVTWVEKFYCACSLFAGRWFSLGFVLMETGLYILLSDEQITAVREQIGVQKLICITIDGTVDALARLTGGWPLRN